MAGGELVPDVEPPDEGAGLAGHLPIPFGAVEARYWSDELEVVGQWNFTEVARPFFHAW